MARMVFFFVSTSEDHWHFVLWSGMVCWGFVQFHGSTGMFVCSVACVRACVQIGQFFFSFRFVWFSFKSLLLFIYVEFFFSFFFLLLTHSRHVRFAYLLLSLLIVRKLQSHDSRLSNLFISLFLAERTCRPFKIHKLFLEYAHCARYAYGYWIWTTANANAKVFDWNKNKIKKKKNKTDAATKQINNRHFDVSGNQ